MATTKIGNFSFVKLSYPLDIHFRNATKKLRFLLENKMMGKALDELRLSPQ